jgi:ribonuclease HI
VIAAVYADGGVIGRNPSPVGGTYAWCHVDECGERVATGSGLVLPDPHFPRDLVSGVEDVFACPAPITNNQTEFLALLRGLMALPEGWSGTVHSDSKITLGRFFWEWKITQIPHEWIRWGSEVRQRLGKCEPVLLDGHPTRAQLTAGVGKRGQPVSEHNVWCDTQCGRVATLCPPHRLGGAG